MIVLFSFNDPQGKFNYSWQGFTLNNWAHPFKYPALTDALKLSLNVAAVSTAFALVLGTLVAIALVRQRFRGRTAVDTFLMLPLTAPEVVMGAALLTLFLDLSWAAGYTTILIAHIAFEISFIAMTVRATHARVRLDAGGCLHGPRRQPRPHILQSDPAADHSGHCGRRPCCRSRCRLTTSSSRTSSAGRR